MIMQEQISKSNILNYFGQALESLTDKEKTVIKKRIWLDSGKYTLNSIWESFNPPVTRERIRQIEHSGIKKLDRVIKATVLINIQNKAKEIVKMHGGLLSKEKLISWVIRELSLDSTINIWVLEIIIQSDHRLEKSKPRLWVDTYFMLPDLDKKSIEAVHKEAISILKNRKDVMDINNLYEIIKINLKANFSALRNVFIDSVLDLFEDIVKWEETLIGLSKWKILNPKTLKDKTLYVMKKEKVPMHFIDISNKITEYMWDKVKVNTIHNELIRNNEFILVGRGIYALKEWGFKNGTVIDVIIDIMKKVKSPLSTKEIINKVLKVRQVKESTIYMNLQNRKYIDRVWRNYYTLKENV